MKPADYIKEPQKFHETYTKEEMMEYALQKKAEGKTVKTCLLYTSALTAGIVCAVFIHGSSFSGGFDDGAVGLSYPYIVMPDFSGNVALTVSLPLVIMALADVFKGYGVLKSNGYDMPLNKMCIRDSCWCRRMRTGHEAQRDLLW